MRILFLPRYPERGASSRYRIFQYLPALERLGVSATVVPFMDDELFALSYRSGATAAKAWHTVRAFVRRLRALRDHGRYDVIYMQRELFPFVGPFVERWLKRRGAKLVFDYDDALFIAKPSAHSPLASLFRNAGKVREILELCDLVIAGNDYLRDQARAVGTPAATLHVAERVDRVRPRYSPSTGEGLVVGWLGSPSTEKYLETIRGPLDAFFAAHPGARLVIVGGGKFEGDFPVEHVAWSPEAEVAALERFDIGLMPLPMDDWSLGKSGGKARTYMAASVPAICTGIGYNLELLDDGRTGMLVRDADEWSHALETLAASPETRRAMGEAARRDVAERFDVDRTAGRMVDLLRDVTSARTQQHLPEEGA